MYKIYLTYDLENLSLNQLHSLQKYISDKLMMSDANTPERRNFLLSLENIRNVIRQRYISPTWVP